MIKVETTHQDGQAYANELLSVVTEERLFTNGSNEQLLPPPEAFDATPYMSPSRVQEHNKFNGLPQSQHAKSLDLADGADSFTLDGTAPNLQNINASLNVQSGYLPQNLL